MINTYKYSDIKCLLTESLLENFPDTAGDEIEAIVTHLLQSPVRKIPYLTKEMREHCFKLLNVLGKNGKILKRTSESRTYYEPKLNLDWEDIPFPPPKSPTFTFIDLFAGIGGFRIAMQELNGKCVFSSEWDPYSKRTYEANFGEVPFGDIRKIPESSIPDHDILCAGFPCQPFSLAGVSARNSLNTVHGFACETQGTLFFDIVRIIKEKKPRIVFLENVKNIVNHDGGKTFKIIRDTLESMEYKFSHKLIDSSSLVAQKRIRCYMVCIKDAEDEFIFPEMNGPSIPLKSILENEVDSSYTISSKLWAGHQRRTSRNILRGTGFTAYCADLNKPSNTIVARYGKDGKECLIPQENDNPRMLTPRECARLQGFPENFKIPVAKTSAYRQFGNSVAIPVISLIANKFNDILETKEITELK